MKLRHSLIALAVLLTFGACAKNEPPGKAEENIVAKINGKPLSVETFETYATAATRRPAKDLTPEQRAQVLDGLIAMQLAADTAEKSGMGKKSEIEIQLALTKMNLLSEAAFKKYLEDHPITDAELKAEYELQVGTTGREYHARHILVESRAAADDLVAQLNKGGDFAKLAEKHSIDGSAKQGGDLGWFNLKTMVPQFASAVSTLEKGKYTAAPVQTQFGWHIIKLEDTRTPAAPNFDDVKEQVKNILQQKKIRAYAEDLRKAAKIEKMEPAKQAAAAPALAPAPTEKPAEAK
jgi:peptidyl-prolyl cis-trans isomerase C